MLQTLTVSCRGGLDLSSNVQELLGRPGEAIQLKNYECSKEGGYRRLSGHEIYGVSVPGSGRIKGVHVLTNQGLLVARDTSLYHTFDGSYWVAVNKVSDDVDEATLDSLPETQRLLSDFYTFTEYKFLDETHVFITDATGNPMFLRIKGNDRASATYTYRDITLGSDLQGATQCEIFKDQLFLVGMPGNPSTMYYSSLATTDIYAADGNITPREKFDGATSGFLGVSEDIIGIKAFRETLYIFCANSIWKAQGMDTGSPQVVPVTRDIGCVDLHTIQEIGGDLLFLAPDGIRTIAGTERIGDIELGIISRKVQPMLDRVLKNPTDYRFRSVVLKAKNQYRLTWSNPSEANVNKQQGIIAAYVFDPSNGQAQWCFSETNGIEVSEIAQGDYDNLEGLFHGDFSGVFHQDERGSTYSGRTISHVFQSPFIDFGNIGQRKTMYKVFLTMKPEGDVNLGMELRYDYQSSDAFQPPTFVLDQITGPSLYGSAIYGQSKYGARDLPNREVHVEGSGKTVSVRIVDREMVDAPFDIQSLVYEIAPNGSI